VATKDTPRSLGYHMPAEWEHHESTWIAWPHNQNDWPGKFEAIPWVYAEIVRHLSHGERIEIIVRDANEQNRARGILESSRVELKRTRFHFWPTNRVWTRDSGPLFVRRDQKRHPIAVTNWGFNAWAKYPDWKEDCRLPERIAQRLGFQQFDATLRRSGVDLAVILEGGSIDVNGRGLMLTTEECLLSRVQQRNRDLSRKDLEVIFADYLGVEKVIWLGQGIVGDDTHGHVDDIARFVAADTVLTVVEANRLDPNYAPLQENLRRLRAAKGLDGRKMTIVQLPMPRPVIFRNQRLPASYANFYIANHAVLVPTFNDPSDRVALNILAEIFPGREVVGIYCRDFIWGLGAIHCMTQQQPASR